MRSSSQRSSPFGIKGLYQKNEVFYFRGEQVGGFRPKAVCLKTSDLTTAILEAERLRHEHVLAIEEMKSSLPHDSAERFGKFKRHAGHAKFSELIALYLVEKNQNGDFRPATLRCNTQMLEQSCRVMGDPFVGKIDRDKIQSYSWWLKDKSKNPGRRGEGLSEATIHTYLNRLRCFFSWAVQTKKIRVSPMAEVKIGRVRVTKIHDFFSVSERESLLAMKNVQQDVMSIFYLGFFAGLRFMEMLSLRWCDVQDEMAAAAAAAGGDGTVVDMGDKDRMHLLIRAHTWFVPKGKAARVVPAPARLRSFLRGIKPGGVSWSSTDYVIAPQQEWRADASNGYRYNPKKSFKKTALLGGIERAVSYHSLRHSYITHHLNAGTSMSIISQWSGDDEETLRSHYAGYSPDVSKVEAIG